MLNPLEQMMKIGSRQYNSGDRARHCKNPISSNYELGIVRSTVDKSARACVAKRYPE